MGAPVLLSGHHIRSAPARGRSLTPSGRGLLQQTQTEFKRLARKSEKWGAGDDAVWISCSIVRYSPISDTNAPVPRRLPPSLSPFWLLPNYSELRYRIPGISAVF